MDQGRFDLRSEDQIARERRFDVASRRPLAPDGDAWERWADSWMREFVSARGCIRPSDLAAACDAFDQQPPHPSFRSSAFARWKAAKVLAPDLAPEQASPNPAANARRERAYVRGERFGEVA
jgi:hypothetical protein